MTNEKAQFSCFLVTVEKHDQHDQEKHDHVSLQRQQNKKIVIK